MIDRRSSSLGGGDLASYVGISAAAKSIERLLNACFDEAEAGTPERRARAVLVRTEDLVRRQNGQPGFTTPALTLFAYRVDVNKTMRAAWSAVGSVDGRARLPLDVHFLITPWAENAEHEHRVLGKAMECLETTPILTGPLLYPEPGAHWAPNEAVQVVAGDLSTEEVMRTFDSLPIDYKLSVPYVARVVRIDARRAFAPPSVDEVVRGVAASTGGRP